MAKNSKRPDDAPLDDNPLWFKEAIIYQLHVRAFCDSNADGIGDFPGLTQKLGYLQDLGVTALWLLPFYPSPLKDDGYDISDYTGVHPAYGTLHDFKAFLKEAHRRGIRVITELVLNHTSDQHPWFQRARRSPPGSAAREFYVWSDTPDRYREARIIFQDFETSNWTWDPVAKAYYFHRFYSHQPDLNFDSPAVRKAVLEVVDFWLGLGVDGLRLDAVPYLLEREGTNCENLPETHAFLKELRRHVDAKFRNRMLLAEANQWPEDAAAYFGEGDECHMAFHFPLMPRMFMALRMESRFPVIEILNQTPPIPGNCQWALFLRNHDELTLEMVTDEERDYMYRVFAHDRRARINLGIRRRLAPLLGDDRRAIELMNGLLFSLPGTQVLYYGDEIGMGDNIYLGDRNGVRTPMQWSADRNAGFSRANPQQLYLPVIIDPEYHYEARNVETEQNNPHSLLWWMKHLIAAYKRHRALSRGDLEFLYPENRKVLAFLRRHEEECVLVAANLSRSVQHVELDLSAHAGAVPVEVFGKTPLPAVGDRPYPLTLGPHEFYWLSLEPPRATPAEVHAPVAALPGTWEALPGAKSRAALEEVLPAVLQTRRWFGGKARSVDSVRVLDMVPVPCDGAPAYVAPVRVEYADGDPETYLLTLAHASGERAGRIQSESPDAILARVRWRSGGEETLLYDAIHDRAFDAALLDAIAHRRHLKGDSGEIHAHPAGGLRKLRDGPGDPAEPSVLKGEQSNSSVVFGDRFILKLFRRLDEGVNPDLELGRFLTERARFPHAPPVAGSLEYRRGGEEPATLGVLHGFVRSEGDAWSYTLDEVGRFYQRIRVRITEEREPPPSPAHLLDLADERTPPEVREAIGPYLESARLLGQRTAELHLALASAPEDPDFGLEPFTELYQRALYHGMVGLMDQSFQLLRQRLAGLPETAREEARRVLDLESPIRERFRRIRDRKITAVRTRHHGDYHLGQVLHTGKDFTIIDFEGEPARSLGERRLKRSPLRDVAGMLRSFHYASSAALLGQAAAVRPEDVPALEPWARFWRAWVGAAFLRRYLAVAGDAPFIPRDREELRVLLDAYLLEKAVYELGYELNNRPEWVKIPLRSILDLLETGG